MAGGGAASGREEGRSQLRQAWVSQGSRAAAADADADADADAADADLRGTISTV